MGCFGEKIEEPTAWSEPPSPMSFSALRDIEKCPRRWGLKNATFPQFSGNSGYPTKPSVPAVRGLVIHSVLEDILRRAAGEKEKTLGARVARVLREGGGLSPIVQDHAESILNRYSENPRAQYISAIIQRQPEFFGQVRVAVQKTLRGLGSVRMDATSSGGSAQKGHSPESESWKRGLLSEVPLNGPSEWYGKADLIVFDGDSVRIDDFKSGKPKDDDEEQLRVYAWLFWRDTKWNPTCQIPTDLVLRYQSGNIAVAPMSVEALEQFEKEILERTRSARQLIDSGSYPARVDDDHCPFCPVRQMCESYWEVHDSAAHSAFRDLQLVVAKVLSPRTWKVRVQRGCADLVGETALLTGSMPDLEIAAGDIVRALGVKVSIPDGDAPDEFATIRLGLSSELFLVEPSVSVGEG